MAIVSEVAMTEFAPLLGLLADVPDPRRAQGQIYKLPHVLLFSILAIVTGANSYRGIVTFIDVNRRKLNAAFGLKWRRAPAHPDMPHQVTMVKGRRFPTCRHKVFVLSSCKRQNTFPRSSSRRGPLRQRAGSDRAP